MKIIPQDNSRIRINFSLQEVQYLMRLTNLIGVPLQKFGGLSLKSRYVVVREEQFFELANSIFDFNALLKSFGIEQKMLTAEHLPAPARAAIRIKSLDFISEKIPKGLFVKKPEENNEEEG